MIDPELQEQLYKKHPANVVRLILNRDEPGDDEHSNRYSRAARFLRNWLREGVLFTEGDPAIYVYHQEFVERGQTFIRRGFMGRARLERFGEGNIHPHEETHSGAKADRFKLWKACRANLSQIFGLYPDPENAGPEHSRSGDRRADAAGGDRPPGRRPPRVAGDRHRDDQPGRRRDGRQAGVHRRRAPPLRDGAATSATTGR